MMAQDIRCALRGFLQEPGVYADGRRRARDRAGASTAVFSAVNTMLLKPPWKNGAASSGFGWHWERTHRTFFE